MHANWFCRLTFVRYIYARGQNIRNKKKFKFPDNAKIIRRCQNEKNWNRNCNSVSSYKCEVQEQNNIMEENRLLYFEHVFLRNNCPYSSSISFMDMVNCIQTALFYCIIKGRFTILIINIIFTDCSSATSWEHRDFTSIGTA